MSKAIGVVKPSSESVGAAGHQPSPQIRKLTKLSDAQRQSKRLPTRRPPSMIISHGRLVSSRLSRRSHPDCRATACLYEAPRVKRLVVINTFSSFLSFQETHASAVLH